MSCCDFGFASPAQSQLGHAVYKLMLTTLTHFSILNLARFLCLKALCYCLVRRCQIGSLMCSVLCWHGRQ